MEREGNCSILRLCDRRWWNHCGSLIRATKFCNPVMFVVAVGSVLTTVLFFQALFGKGEAPVWFILAVSLWLWFTVLFANFAEAMAEGRGKAQAESLRSSRREMNAKKLGKPESGNEYLSVPSSVVPASALKRGDVVLVEAGDFIPCDGEVIQGIASVNESAITGESAPVIRESGDRSAVTGGTRILSDWLVVRITANPGETFLDRMIAMVEGAKRQKTPNEIALNILLAALTVIFLLATATLLPFSALQCAGGRSGGPRHSDGLSRAAGLSDPDDDWRIALCHRNCGDGPHGSGERDRHVRQGCGSRR